MLQRSKWGWVGERNNYQMGKWFFLFHLPPFWSFATNFTPRCVIFRRVVCCVSSSSSSLPLCIMLPWCPVVGRWPQWVFSDVLVLHYPLPGGVRPVLVSPSFLRSSSWLFPFITYQDGNTFLQGKYMDNNRSHLGKWSWKNTRENTFEIYCLKSFSQPARHPAIYPGSDVRNAAKAIMRREYCGRQPVA